MHCAELIKTLLKLSHLIAMTLSRTSYAFSIIHNRARLHRLHDTNKTMIITVSQMSLQECKTIPSYFALDQCLLENTPWHSTPCFSIVGRRLNYNLCCWQPGNCPSGRDYKCLSGMIRLMEIQMGATDVRSKDKVCTIIYFF